MNEVDKMKADFVSIAMAQFKRFAPDAVKMADATGVMVYWCADHCRLEIQDERELTAKSVGGAMSRVFWPDLQPIGDQLAAVNTRIWESSQKNRRPGWRALQKEQKALLSEIHALQDRAREGISYGDMEIILNFDRARPAQEHELKHDKNHLGYQYVVEVGMALSAA